MESVQSTDINIESEAAKEQKAYVEKLTKRLHYLEQQKGYLQKFVLTDDVANPNFEKAKTLLIKLSHYINLKKDELREQDTIWLGLQLADLEKEICPSQH